MKEEKDPLNAIFLVHDQATSCAMDRCSS
jgi:hypothetical protein